MRVWCPLRLIPGELSISWEGVPEEDVKLISWMCRWVQTDMGNTGARSFGMAKATTPVEESVNYMVSLVRRTLLSLAWVHQMLMTFGFRLMGPHARRRQVTSLRWRAGTFHGRG